MSNPAERAADEQQKRDLAKKAGGFMDAFKKAPPFMSVSESLKASGVNYRVMPVMVGDQTEECLVVIMNEMIAGEWRHMTGGIEYDGLRRVDE
jgi:hypothetical protein